MVVMSKDEKILVTQRSSKMNVFPNAWVLPGGHLEIGESLESGISREVYEEVGLKIDENDLKLFLM